MATMETMEAVNKTGKRRHGTCKNRRVSHRAPQDSHMCPAVDGHMWLFTCVDKQGLPVLHKACFYGQLTTVQLLLESSPGLLNSSAPQGWRPIHMVLSSWSAPNTFTCLTYLLKTGADVNVTTNSGLAPLHLAASEGLLECAEILVQAGADVLAKDNMGFIPLDMACIWSHRKVARYLKSCMWKMEKKNEMEERKLVQALYSDLVGMAKLNILHKKTLTDKKMAEWANKKGFPLLKDFSPRVQVSQYHSECLSSNQDHSNPKHAKSLYKQQPKSSSKPAAASVSRPWTIYMGLQPDKPLVEPDLRDSVTVWRDSSSKQPQYTTKWDNTPHAAPDLPLDVLERVFFPRAFLSRIVSPRHFEPQDIIAVQHRGRDQGRSTSPWTEVAMHLAEVLEPGHY